MNTLSPSTRNTSQQSNCFSVTKNCQDRQPTISPLIPQPPYYSPSPQGYTSPVYSANSSTFYSGQSDFRGPFPVLNNTVPSPLNYPPIHPSQDLAQTYTAPHPPGIPFQPTANCLLLSSSGLPSIPQLHASEMTHHNHNLHTALNK